MRRRIRLLVMGRAGTILTLAIFVTTSGCATTLGYIPENIKPRDATNFIPEYGEVKKWAYDVQDGLDSRATANRHAIYFGALLGAAAIGTLAGLAVFDSGSSAIAGIPIGTGFLGGAASIYSSEQKADMYDRASKYVKKLINKSDQRIANGAAKDLNEALCLKRDVDELLRRVGRFIVMMNPKNVSALLSKVKDGVVKDGVASDVVVEDLKAAAGDFSDLDSDGEKVESVCDS